jgi:hypothetical protein
MVDSGRQEDRTMREGSLGPTMDPTTLEAWERDLTRRLLSLICRTTGRRRTREESRHLDALVGQIHDVRHARRDAAHRS